MGCAGSKPKDDYQLSELAPGEKVEVVYRREGERASSSSSSYTDKKDEKARLKNKYKVELRKKRTGATPETESKSSAIKRSRSSSSLESKSSSGRRKSAENVPRRSNSAGASQRARRRFKKAGNAVRASIRFGGGRERRRNARPVPSAVGFTGLSDFDLEPQAVGKGAYSYVRLGKCREDLAYYAIKCVSKEKACRHKHSVKHLHNERDLLRTVEHPFMIRCHGSFQDNVFVYLVLNFVPGGELHRLLYNRRKFSRPMAIFYAAEMLCALEYLHDRHILYRDLKPENVLINDDGHIKIADFGFAIQTDGPDARVFTKVGTPHYLAPEILDMHSNQGYTKAVDIWSWACILYEMIRGRPAFGTAVDSSYAVYLRVMKAKYKVPRSFDAATTSIVRHLMQADIEKRLTSIDEIKSHRMFEAVNWDAVAEQRLRPPYIPRLGFGGDRSHFDSYKLPNYRKANAEENAKFRDF